MKLVLLIFLLFFSLKLSAQEKYYTKSGSILFESSVASFEEVKAKNNSVTAILNTTNGEFASLVLIKGFRFRIALMEEHFNENYMDSDEYPKAILKGKIKGFLSHKLTKSAERHILIGTLTIHGKTIEMDIPVEIKKIDNTIYINSLFSVTPKEFDIYIPKIVRKKIAKKIHISVDFKLLKKNN